MYVGGPLLWGGWMIFRLELLSPGEYARCLLSPLTLAMLAACLAGNLSQCLPGSGRTGSGGRGGRPVDPSGSLRRACGVWHRGDVRLSRLG
jgi:hypothetical protein